MAMLQWDWKILHHYSGQKFFVKKDVKLDMFVVVLSILVILLMIVKDTQAMIKWLNKKNISV